MDIPGPDPGPYLRSLIIVILAISSVRCESFHAREEAEVYRAYINGVYLKRPFSDSRFAHKPFAKVVICDLTPGISFPYQEIISQMSIKPDGDTVESFLSRNGGNHPKSSDTGKVGNKVGRYPINREMKFDLPHVLISNKEIDRILNHGGWDDFYERYPDCRGIVWLSRVGFNSNRSQALLYFGNQYTEYAGEGYLILLTKMNGAWKVAAQVTVWIS